MCHFLFTMWLWKDIRMVSNFLLLWIVVLWTFWWISLDVCLHSSTGIYIRMKNLTYSCKLFICTHNFFFLIFFLSTFVIPIEISLFHFMISLVRMMDREAWGTHSMRSQKVGHDWACTQREREESLFHVITNFHFYMSHSKVNFYQLGTFSLSLPPNTHTHIHSILTYTTLCCIELTGSFKVFIEV